eukprot:1442437-Amphidinium_carterae.1
MVSDRPERNATNCTGQMISEQIVKQRTRGGPRVDAVRAKRPSSPIKKYREQHRTLNQSKPMRPSKFGHFHHGAGRNIWNTCFVVDKFKVGNVNIFR